MFVHIICHIVVRSCNITLPWLWRCLLPASKAWQLIVSVCMYRVHTEVHFLWQQCLIQQQLAEPMSKTFPAKNNIVPLSGVWPFCKAAGLQIQLCLLLCRTAPPRNSLGMSQRKAAGPALWRTHPHPTSIKQTDACRINLNKILILAADTYYVFSTYLLRHGSPPLEQLRRW